MRSSQRSVCDTVSEAVSQAQGRASRFTGNVLLGMAGQDDETMVMPSSAAGAGAESLRLHARAGRRGLQMSQAESTKEERLLEIPKGALSTQH